VHFESAKVVHSQSCQMHHHECHRLAGVSSTFQRVNMSNACDPPTGCACLFDRFAFANNGSQCAELPFSGRQLHSVFSTTKILSEVASSFGGKQVCPVFAMHVKSEVRHVSCIQKFGNNFSCRAELSDQI